MSESEQQKNEVQIIQDFQNIYSPATLLGVFANALKSPADGRLLLARGEYQASINAKEYSGYYYEDIKSPSDNKFIKAKIPAFVRSKLENQNIYIFKGYIEKRIGNSSIELIFVVDDIQQKEEKQISEEDLKRFEVIQSKIGKGFRNFESITKEHIYNDKPLRIANVYGNSAIVDKDFDKAIAEAKVKYDITTFKCSFSSKEELISLIRKLNTPAFDAIAFIRGGGEPAAFENFNDADVCAETIKLKPLLLTALGHAMNVTLMDKVADRKFALPFDYGNSLKVWVDEAIAEQSKSKSLFIDQVKKDLQKTYEDQIKTKDEAIKSLQKNYEETSKQKDETIKNLQKTYEETGKQMVKLATAEIQVRFDGMKAENTRLNQQLSESSKSGSKIIIWVIIAAIIGLVLGLLIK